jgi:FdhD protein
MASRHGVHTVTAWRVPQPGGPARAQTTQVIEEDALTIDVEAVGTFTLMWTPTEGAGEPLGFTDEDGVLADSDDPEALALAVGFCFTEGLIAGLGDIRTMAVCADTPGVVRVQLRHPKTVVARRKNIIMTSSCGICGSRDVLDNNLLGLRPVPDNMRLGDQGFAHLMALMRERQAVFLETGGAHAAAVFGTKGALHAVAEDLGRHNALDKVIGKTLLTGAGFANRGVLLSSRLSLEMVVKSVRAGFEIIAAVSAPTSLAIEVAERFGVTLCGFVRDQRATIYTHPHRIAPVG